MDKLASRLRDTVEFCRIMGTDTELLIQTLREYADDLNAEADRLEASLATAPDRVVPNQEDYHGA